MIQFLSLGRISDLKKERLTKDVRYQEFTEVTRDCSVETERSWVTSFYIVEDGYLALPLGELAAKPTERENLALPKGELAAKPTERVKWDRKPIPLGIMPRS